MAKVRIQTPSTFERFEKKFLLNKEQYDALLPQLCEHMEADAYGRHTICTLYYDTEDYAVIRRSLEKPSFKTKLRLRSYGVPCDASVVYLELKKKLGGITYKRRVPLGHGEAVDYLDHGWPPATLGQIFDEIDWYIAQQPLAGKVVLCYDRIALAGLENPSLRLTLDANIRWRDYSLDLSKGDHGAPLLPPGTRLMEIKTMNALPLWLSEMLCQNGIFPQSYSKYGSVYQNHLATKERLLHVC